MKDGSLEDNILADTRELLLTETEADSCWNIKTSTYPGTYKINPDELSSSPVYRYSSTVKNQHRISSDLVRNPAPASLLNRCLSIIQRHKEKESLGIRIHKL